MKIITVLGTRPEIIRLSRIIPLLDKFCEHTLVYTDQNYDPNLKNIFFDQLKVRQPDVVLDTRSKTTMEQIGKILSGIEKVFQEIKPDRLLILGDTNSGLSAFVAKRFGIPVYHMEAGNRCHDDRVPEEVNRKVIDHSSTIQLPYTERSRDNLLREGILNENIYVVGNPIFEVLNFYEPKISASKILSKLKLNKNKYFLVTLHRAENVDVPDRLVNFVEAFNLLVKDCNLPIIWSVHPRTKDKLDKLGQKIKLDKKIHLCEPFGLFDFVKLEKNAYCVLSDSGTVQEECCIFGVPTVTLRDTTERPETIEVGSNILSGSSPEDILRCTKIVLDRKGKWQPPKEYLVENVSNTVAKIILGYSGNGDL